MLRLQELRKNKKLKQSELAEILHVKQNTISNWENGKTEINNSDAIVLADFFDVSVDYLLGREEKPFTEKELSKEEKELALLISQLNEEEVNELSNFVDYIISKRK